MERLAARITNYLVQSKKSYTQEQIETIQFGMECILSETSKMVVYFAIFSLLNLTVYYLIAMVYFCLLRLFAGGFHADTYIQCFIISLSILTFGIITGSEFGLDLSVRIVILVISALMIIIYAPVDHPNKPIISLERKKRAKYLAILVFIALAGVTFLMDERLAASAVMILFLEAISLPIGNIYNEAKRCPPPL